MQLTRYTDYGLRVLSYLALLPQHKLATINEICLAYDLKKNHVSKIIHQLSRAQLIETRRGKGGGFKLNHSSLQCGLGDLILLLEGEGPLVECVQPPCKIQLHCQLKGILAQAKATFIDYLNRYQLEDLITGPRLELIALLQIEELTDGY